MTWQPFSQLKARPAAAQFFHTAWGSAILSVRAIASRHSVQGGRALFKTLPRRFEQTFKLM
jgi:hypothetical protein